MTYRREIDGLRAVAVLCVLLFHCEFSLFSGGFVGVDVFFVISGFLITGIILADLEHRRFSFKTFYIRRIRRLLPALLATAGLTVLAGMLILAPEHLVNAGRAGGLAVLSLSNFYFSKQAAYFDPSSKLDPLLHMWSLSLEEQYYFFWPATLFLLFRFRQGRFLPAFIGVGIVGGLVLSQHWISVNPKQAYFLLPFRAFQFLLGAGCLWFVRYRSGAGWPRAIAFICGIGLILASAITYTDTTPFPGLRAVPPSVGAALLIWAGDVRPFAWIVSNRVSVWLGRISYSAYLVHWPIIVYWRYVSVDAFTTTEKLGLLVLSICGGQLMYTLVEKRYRLGRESLALRAWKPAISLSIAGIPLLAFCVFLGQSNGLPGRLDLRPETAHYRRESQFQFLRDYRDGSIVLGGGRQGHILIFGDSMMQNYIPALLELDVFRNATVDVITRGGCVMAKGALMVNYGTVDQGCRRLRDDVYASRKHYDLVVWSQNWLSYQDNLAWESPKGILSGGLGGDVSSFSRWKRGVQDTIAHFQGRSDAILVVGPQVAASNVSPLLARIGPLSPVSTIRSRLADMRDDTSVIRGPIVDGMHELVGRFPNARLIDPRDIVCATGKCLFAENGYSYYLDEIHHTAAATAFLRDRLEGLLAHELAGRRWNLVTAKKGN